MIYDPANPNNTGLGNSDWRRILVDGDAIQVNPSVPQDANITITGDLTAGQSITLRVLKSQMLLEELF